MQPRRLSLVIIVVFSLVIALGFLAWETQHVRAQTTRVVTTLSDISAGTCSSTACTLRDAIAVAAPGAIITFDPNLADSNGISPLVHARQRGYKEIIAILQGAGAR